MRRGWKTCVLAIVMLSVFWILVLPQVDLDPATPLNLETFFFALVAISVLLGGKGLFQNFLQQFSPTTLPVAQAPPLLLTARTTPLRL